MSASDAVYSEREKRTEPQRKIISILHAHQKTVVRTSVRSAQPSSTGAIQSRNGYFIGNGNADGNGRENNFNASVNVSTGLNMTQLGAEIELSVQNLEQEMKVSENQLNYLEVSIQHSNSNYFQYCCYCLYINIIINEEALSFIQISLLSHAPIHKA